MPKQIEAPDPMERLPQVAAGAAKTLLGSTVESSKDIGTTADFRRYPGPDESGQDDDKLSSRTEQDMRFSASIEDIRRQPPSYPVPDDALETNARHQQNAQDAFEEAEGTEALSDLAAHDANNDGSAQEKLGSQADFDKFAGVEEPNEPQGQA